MADFDLQGLLGQLGPLLGVSEEEKRAARMQALATFGLGLMGARKGEEWNRVGMSGLNAMNQYQGSLAGIPAAKLNQMKAAGGLMELQQKLAADRQEADTQRQLGGIFDGGPQLGNMGPGGPTLQNAAAAAPPSKADQYRLAAALYAKGGNSKKAKEFAEIAEKMDAQYSPTPQTVIGPDGKPQLVLIGNRGETKTLTGMSPKPEYKEVSTNQEKFFYDPLTGAKTGGFQMQMTPGEVASNKVAQGNLAIAQSADRRAAANQGANEWDTNMDRGVQVNKRTGETRPITSGGAPIGNALDQKRKQAGQTVNEVLDIAEPLIKKATGSLAGSLVDKAASVYGVATKGAEKTAQLQALEGQLMLAQPRMEGPQSDRDTQLYRQMAGKIADDTLPRETRLAAVQVLRQIYKRYEKQQPAGAGVVDFSALPK